MLCHYVYYTIFKYEHLTSSWSVSKINKTTQNPWKSTIYVLVVIYGCSGFYVIVIIMLEE